jgi:hypothetical protein
MKYMSNEQIEQALDAGRTMSIILKDLYLDETSIWYKSPALQVLLKQYFDAIGCAEC